MIATNGYNLVNVLSDIGRLEQRFIWVGRESYKDTGQIEFIDLIGNLDWLDGLKYPEVKDLLLTHFDKEKDFNSAAAANRLKYYPWYPANTFNSERPLQPLPTQPKIYKMRRIYLHFIPSIGYFTAEPFIQGLHASLTKIGGHYNGKYDLMATMYGEYGASNYIPPNKEASVAHSVGLEEKITPSHDKVLPAQQQAIQLDMPNIDTFFVNGIGFCPFPRQVAKSLHDGELTGAELSEAVRNIKAQKSTNPSAHVEEANKRYYGG